MNNTDPIMLIVHPGSLGDVLLAVEAIRILRQDLPFHQVVWVGQSEIGRLLLEWGEVHEVIGIEGPLLSQLFSSTPRLDDHAQVILERCTHCVCWMTDPDKIIEKNLRSLGIRSIIQSPQSAEYLNFHHQERFLGTLQSWGIRPGSTRKRMPPSGSHFPGSEDESLRHRFSFLTTPYFVIHPGSGSKHKCLNSALLGKVARGLLEHSEMSLVILEGPADQSQVKNLRDEIPDWNPHLLSNQPLITVAQVLKEAALYIGHDSGISHLAAGVGTPSILLFGPTNPGYWAPRGDHVTTVQGPTCQCTDWSQVQQCQQKSCLDLSVDLIIQKAEHTLSLRRKTQISDFQSQKHLDDQNPIFKNIEIVT